MVGVCTCLCKVVLFFGPSRVVVFVDFCIILGILADKGSERLQFMNVVLNS